jgi:hypothetical protein
MERLLTIYLGVASCFSKEEGKAKDLGQGLTPESIAI